MDQPSPSPKPRVLAVVVARRGEDISAVSETIRQQVYEVEDVVVISDDRPPPAAEDSGSRTFRRLSDALGTLDPTVPYLWMLDARTTARPDALEALVEAAERLEASVVGSKILDADHPDRLRSVGGATDVFGFPHSGLEHGEIDQEQFEVIRDVAFLEPASLLVRRDLVEGLGGLDHSLPYLSFGLDICQRTRVVGGRVVVTPASEVFSPVGGANRAMTWREQAGRLRVMLKTYSIATLLWALPGLFLVGLAQWVYLLFKGAPAAFLDWVRTWTWNLLHLPSSWAARRRAPSTSLKSDAELFRYQLKGSLELGRIGSELGTLLGTGYEVDESDDPGPALWQRPDFITTVLGIALILMLNRSIITDGLPAIGFVLPLAESAWDTLRVYTGGWHPGGLGSPEPLHPSVGATALIQLILGNRPGLAAGWLTVGAVSLGLAGIIALVRRLGLSPGARLIAGAVYVAGFPLIYLAGEGYWPALLGLGGLPWALVGVIAPLPETVPGRIKRTARVGLATIASAVFVPVAVVLPLLFGLVWSGLSRRLRPLVIGSAGFLLSLPVLFPWLGVHGAGEIITAGTPFHPAPSWWVYIPLVAVAAGTMFFGQGGALKVGMAGGIIGSAGVFLSSSSDLGVGREASVAGLLAMALGLALITAAAIDLPSSLGLEVPLWRSFFAYATLVAALLVGLSTLIPIPAGRMGLPDDRFETLGFAVGRSEAHGADRMLVTGPAETIPGQHRLLSDGTPYRLLSGTLDYAQAWLPAPRLGDIALEETLTNIMASDEIRPGQHLSGFGIRWLVATGPSPLTESMATQLDMNPLVGLYVGESGGVWENQVPSYRAVTDSGVAWSWAVPDYQGEPTPGQVRIAENADPGWGPEPWEQDGWANLVSAESGAAVFEGVSSYRLQARAAGLFTLLLLALSLLIPETKREEPST